MKSRLKSALVLVLAANAFGGAAARAEWVPEGVAVCAAINAQTYPQIVPDGSGGAIVVWQDTRNGNDDIFAQRIAADGSVMWQADGVALCLEPHSQQRVRIVPDGFGGAVAAWQDFRSPLGTADIYAQRVDASGATQWTADGVAVCAASGEQNYPSLAPDGTGGAVIAWMDARPGATSLYVQRIDGAGSAVWNLDGFPLYPSGGATSGRNIIPDGVGGAIVAWTAGENVYAQKLAPNSAVQWTANAALVCSAAGEKIDPAIVSDGSGGAVVLWVDGRNGDSDIYAQRLDAGGASQWTANGVPVCRAASYQEHPALVGTGSGGAVAVWQDWRFGTLIGDITFYAQRIDPGGSTLWTEDGVLVGSGSMSLAYPDAAGDGAGGAIVAWWIYAGGVSRGYVQRLDAGGALRWIPGGVPLNAEPEQIMPVLVPDQAGGAIVAWADRRDATLDVYAQRFGEGGVIPVATLLRSYSIAFTRGTPTIAWTLSSIDPGLELFVERAAGAAAPYEERPAGLIGRDGLTFVFVDEGCEPGASYWYRVGARAGEERNLLFETGRVEVPAAPLALMQNRPNPFNPATAIEYTVPRAGEVTLEIFDVSGRKVATLLDRARVAAGKHTVQWNGMDAEGRQAGSGVYYYRLTSGKETVSRKMVLLK